MENKSKHAKAVALRYKSKADPAPKVIARGRGKTAEKIIEIAREHNIYVHNDPDLVEVLSRLDLNEEIPANLYVVVAELLAFIYSLNREEKSR